MNLNLKLTRPLAAIDLETTGSDPEVDAIIQLGVVKVNTDGRTKEWETYVNPQRPIPKEGTRVHGITDVHVRAAKTFKELAPVLGTGLKDCDLCGYNVMFDVKFLIAEFRRAGYKWEPGKLVDGLKIFYHKEPRNLTAAVEFFLGKSHDKAHTALADARAALEVVNAQLDRYPDLPREVDKLHHMYFETAAPGFVDPLRKFKWVDGEAVITFGKHKSKRLCDVPRDYLEWIMGSDFDPPIKDIVRKALDGDYPKMSS